MTSKRIALSKEEWRIILDALQNQVWTYDKIKTNHIGIPDEKIDQRKVEVEDIYQKLRQKLRNHG